MGPRKISGIRATIDAVASTVAEPVSLVSHHASANWTTLLPINESACPVQMVKNGNFQGVAFNDCLLTVSFTKALRLSR